MKKILYLLFFCLLILVQIACGQSSQSNIKNTTKPQTAQTITSYPSLKIQAQEVSDATVNGDFGKVIDYTYPTVVELAGGKDKMISFMEKDFAQMKKDGLEMISATVGDAKQIEKIDDKLFALMDLTLKMKMPGGKVQGESSLIGISEDSGANWKFINGVNQERFKKMFPKVAEKIQIPAEQPPKPIEK